MIDTFYIGAYWGSRHETLKEIATRTTLTLEKLGQLDEQFSKWYELGISRKKALEKRVLIEKENIELLYKKSIKKGELNDSGFTTHFFSLGLWSGHKEDEASNISFNVGGEFSTDKISNSCFIKIPLEGDSRNRLLKLQKSKSLLSILIEIWNPDKAVLTSHELNKLISGINEIGWITYKKSNNKLSKIDNRMIHQAIWNGNLFYLNLTNDNVYDYSLIDDLRRLKE